MFNYGLFGNSLTGIEMPSMAPKPTNMLSTGSLFNPANSVGGVGPTIGNASMITPSYMKPSAFENAMTGAAGVGSLLGGAGSLYSAYEMNKYLEDQMDMQRQAFNKNMENAEQREQLNF